MPIRPLLIKEKNILTLTQVPNHLLIKEKIISTSTLTPPLHCFCLTMMTPPVGNIEADQSINLLIIAVNSKVLDFVEPPHCLMTLCRPSLTEHSLMLE